MSDALVFCCVAFGEEKGGSVNITQEERRMDIYYENTFVALKTILDENPTVDVGMITTNEVPIKYSELFERNNIKIWKAPFDEFKFSPQYRWYLAFYKLCSYKWALANLGYKYLVQIDCDVVCNNSINDLLQDLKYGIVMLSGPFSYNHVVRREYRDLYMKIYQEDVPMIKWGSGLIAGERERLSKFINVCDDVYCQMLSSGLKECEKVGDEFITSVAAILSGLPVLDGKPYMHVYWTGKFYLVSTNYHFDRVALLHVPVEKEIGMHMIFNYFVKHGSMPKKDKMYKWLSLPKIWNPYICSYWRAVVRKIKRKIKFL